ncbi:MAG: hypothetical protein J6S85_21785 [Methanobrevibacter sp.]|nr:hypothetical protein [Methanobrevibacter sp.]
MSNPSSTIILYKDTKIIPSRNMVVDSLSDYLATLTKLTINDFQYQRHHLEMDIKIDKTQVWQEFEALNNYNYLSIQNSDSTRVVYYFIMNKTQYANSTINLHLMMDTANTFKWNVDFVPTERTRVIREHKDRIKQTLNGLILDYTLASGLTDEGLFQDVETSLKVRIYDSDNNTIREFDCYGMYDTTNQTISLKNVNREDIDWILAYPNANFDEIIIYDANNGDVDLLGVPKSAFTNYYTHTRAIDYYSEGLECPLYKTELGRLTHKEDMSWNLVYHNDTDQAINCHCIPANDGLQAEVITSQTLTYTDFEDGEYYDIAPFNVNGYIQNIQLTDNDGDVWNVGEGKNIKQIHRSGTTLRIRSATFGTTYSWKTITSLSYSVDKVYYYKTSESSPSAVYRSGIHVLDNKFKRPTGSFDATAGTLQEMESLDDINRVDEELIKIITIPYFPSSYVYNEVNNSITPDSTWTYSTALYKGFRLNNLNTQFTSEIKSSINNPLNVLNLGVLSPSITESRNDYYESKLFHSDYYQPKFVYDSFGFVFALEKINEEYFHPSEYFTFEFIMTSTINSKFMFKFPEYILKMSTEDYDNILPVARNNEAPIYNSAYITYLRTAYRYDLKQYDWRTFNRVQSFVSGTIGNLVSGGSAVAGGGGFAGAFFNTAFGQINNTLAIASASQTDQISMEAKREMLKHQRNSVSGSDDLDLLENYSGNRAKLCLYQVSPRMKSLLADLFYYYGYLTDEIKIPSLTSRLWFNYIQCNLEVNTTGKNIPDELMENIKQRYASGITIFHKVSGIWNLEQDLENWEVSLL